MDDYQDNIRRAIRLIGCELGISNNVFPPQRTARNGLNVDDWLERVSQITTDLYSPDDGVANDRDTPQVRDPPYSFNRSPPPQTRPNIRRGFVYTQLIEPRDEIDNGITSEQIANSTRLIQYDGSMNETRCPITWDHFEPGQNILQINNCSHIFGEPALMEWFRRHSRCPVCRSSVLREQESPSTETPNDNREGSFNLRGNVQMNANVGNVSGSINNILSGILSSVNGATNTETGYYESEFTFNVDDLLNAYTQLLGAPTSTSEQPRRPPQ